MYIIDALGQKVFLPHTPKRIISLVPSITESLVDLGLSESIVGVTKFCVFPKSIRQTKQVVGGTKKIDIRKIEIAKPDIILCNKEENTKEMVEMLRTRYPVYVNEIKNISDALKAIIDYGSIFKVSQQAALMVKEILKQKKQNENIISNARKYEVAYYIWKEPWMVAGGQTFINQMLKHAGFNNHYQFLARYPEVPVANIAPEVEVILLSSEPFPFKTSHQDDLNRLFPEKKIVRVDGTYFSWHGSRLRDAFSYFKKLREEISILF